MYLRLNLYASQRFPHNSAFVRNLLSAYSRRETYNEAAWEALLRRHWFEESDLRNQFFEFLTRTGKLDAEIKSLQQGAPRKGKASGRICATKILLPANIGASLSLAFPF